MANSLKLIVLISFSILLAKESFSCSHRSCGILTATKCPGRGPLYTAVQERVSSYLSDGEVSNPTIWRSPKYAPSEPILPYVEQETIQWGDPDQPSRTSYVLDSPVIGASALNLFTNNMGSKLSLVPEPKPKSIKVIYQAEPVYSNPIQIASNPDGNFVIPLEGFSKLEKAYGPSITLGDLQGSKQTDWREQPLEEARTKQWDTEELSHETSSWNDREASFEPPSADKYNVEKFAASTEQKGQSREFLNELVDKNLHDLTGGNMMINDKKSYSPWEISRSAPLPPKSRNLLGDIDPYECSILVQEWVSLGASEIISHGFEAVSSLDLHCTFEEQCCWETKNTQLSFAASGRIPDDIMTTCFKTTTQPNGGFGVFVAGEKRRQIAFESCRISCTSSSIVVKFKHWTSATVSIEVCSQEIYSGNTECIKVSKGVTPLPAGESIAVLNQPAQPFTVQIVLRGFTNPATEIAFIDDISLSFDDCVTNPDNPPPREALISSTDEWNDSLDQFNPYEVANLRSRHGEDHVQLNWNAGGKSNVNACQNVVCDFEDGSLCKWNDVNNFGKTSVKWSVAGGGAAIGLKYAASYLLAHETSDLYTVAQIHAGHMVEFWHFEATLNVQLIGCCGDGMHNCPFVSSPAVKENNDVKWTVSTFSCPPNTDTVHFICRNQGVYQGACGLDGIALISKKSKSPLC